MHLPTPAIRLPLSGEDGPENWLYLVVARHTGVKYFQQYGGLLCRQAEEEGFLVPVTAPATLNAFHALFKGELAGLGRIAANERDRILTEAVPYLRDVLRSIEYPGEYTEAAAHIVLDEERLSELDEAWVPVKTPDGPGYLAWVNSD
jgi:Family of unknown function (DUF6210)